MQFALRGCVCTQEEEAAERASSLSLQRQSIGMDRPVFKRRSTSGHDQLPDGSEVPADTDSSDSDSEVDEVEMVLEAYFMQLDNTYNKLQTLCEYIDDTEVGTWLTVHFAWYFVFAIVCSRLSAATVVCS